MFPIELPPPEAFEASTQGMEQPKLDDATYEPSAYIEQVGDYQQAEAIQTSLVALMDATAPAPAVDAGAVSPPVMADAPLPLPDLAGETPGDAASTNPLPPPMDQAESQPGLPERETLPREMPELADQIDGIGTQGAFAAKSIPDVIPGGGIPGGRFGNMAEDSPLMGGAAGGQKTPQGWGNFPGQKGHGTGQYDKHPGSTGSGGGSSSSGSGLPMNNHGPGSKGSGGNDSQSTPDYFTEDSKPASEPVSPAPPPIDNNPSGEDPFAPNMGKDAIKNCADPSSLRANTLDGDQPVPYTGKMFYEAEPEKNYIGGKDEEDDSGQVMPMVMDEGKPGGPVTADPGDLDDTGRAYGGISGGLKIYPDSGGALPIDPIPASELEFGKSASINDRSLQSGLKDMEVKGEDYTLSIHWGAGGVVSWKRTATI